MCLKVCVPLQKELIQSVPQELIYCPNRTDLFRIKNLPIIRHILDVCSALGDLIGLILFALAQASLDTIAEYPQHAILYNQ